MYHGTYVLILRRVYVEFAVKQGDPALLRFGASTVVTSLAAPLFRDSVLEVRDQNRASSSLPPFHRGIRML